MNRIRRGGFTLIELLVCVAIFAILVGLVLAAVQKVRSAGAKIACANNLRQIGVALHNYHQSHSVFPAGVDGGRGPNPMLHVNWSAKILPYVERPELWDAARAAYAKNPFFLSPPHARVRKTPVAAFSCPADPRFGAYDPAAPLPAMMSYLGVEGTDQTSQDGILYLDSKVRLADVRDGASNTVLVGERPPSADRIFGWWYAGWGQNKDGSTDGVLGAREAVVHPGYARCDPEAVTFREGDINSQCDALHFWSLHGSGANMLYADGSVRFLYYNCGPTLYSHVTRSNGD